MRTSLILFLSLFAWLIPTTIQGQTGKFYSPDKELSNSLINKIYQDNKGFIWIATENGLNKFDGNRFTTYRHQQTDSQSLKNNYVRTLFEDSQDRFWIGCINGLQRYDRATDKFYDISIERPDGRIDPHITSITERSNGDLWIATSGQGILSLKNGKTEDEFQVEHELTERIQSIYINVIFEDSHKTLWIATEDKGLFRYFPETGNLQFFSISRGNGYDEVSAICEDNKGNILAGTLTGGLFIFRQSERLPHLPFSPVPYHNGMSLSIRTLLKDKQGRLFIGTDGEGLKIYNPEKKVIEESEIVTAPFDFSKAKVHSLIEDKDGNFWLGIFQKGVLMIPGDLHRFQYYGYKSVGRNSIGSGCVMAIFRDKEGIIWVGTDNDGLYAIDEEGNTLNHLSRNPSDPNSVPGTITSIYEDSYGQLWIGSYFHGLAQVDKRTGKCSYFPIVSPGQTTAHDKISYITEDKDKNLWIGTYGAGLFKLNLLTRQITAYESSRNDDNDWTLNLLPNDWICSIVSDSEGLLWIGTYKGLACFHSETHSFINFKGVNNLLPGHAVYHILEAKNGIIWIGTTEGLLSFDKTTETFRHYTTTNGLPNEVICGIAEDNDGNLWISTHQGLSRFVINDEKFINYFAGDGIQGNEFTRGAVFKDTTGKLYFGGINGITAFYPQDIREWRKEMKVNITEFYLPDHPVTQGDKSGRHIITDQAVLESDRFTLRAEDNSFSIEFSVMEYVNPERVRYRYRIDELGKEWLATPAGAHRLTFSNLNPGKYSFHVQAYDHENYSDIRSFRVTILPPWYQTWWAYLIWTILTLIVFYFIAMYILTRIRHKQEILRREHLQQINEAKLQFFINISHEIRTPMTLIIHPLEKLISEQSEKTPTYLMIYRNAQRILRLINQLMDIRKLDKGQMQLKFRETDMVGFINDLMQTFEYQAGKSQIDFRFIHAEKELKVWIDLNNFDKILMNILSNAFKYTPKEGCITIELTTGRDEAAKGALKNYFEITVTDNGIGIDEDKIEEIFERFYQINNDVTLSNFGTGIGLHLSRSLVQLHHGIIRAENREDGPGSRFIIRLPLGSDHLRSEELQQPDGSNLLSLPEEKKTDSPSKVQQPETEEEEKIRSKTRYRILVAEDDDEIRRYIRKELSSEYRMLESTNGQEAWEIALKEQPDLIITDVMMPFMDGLTLCRKVKQHTNISHIPVIMLTAKTMQEDHMEGLDSGADAYLTKPFRIDMLISTVRNLIGNRERLKGKFTGEQQTDEKITKIQMRSADEILLEKVMKTIDEHLSDPALNVEMLAANVGISRVHMHRKLKELTNQSARDFIRSIRLKQASILLKEKNLTVSEIAYATGFSNLSHFSNSFREFYGMSPTEYKEQHM